METAGPRRILIVDDDVELLALLTDLVGAEGHATDTAPNGKVALDLIASHDYDLVLCDIRMPVLDGPGLYDEVASRAPHLLRRFIFMAADAEEQKSRLVQFLERTGVLLIAKPFTKHAIARAIFGREY